MFINLAMNPVNYARDPATFAWWRDELNVVLAFSVSTCAKMASSGTRQGHDARCRARPSGTTQGRLGKSGCTGEILWLASPIQSRKVFGESL
jgi:hypothetical protein